jgi:hypothetical protein
MQLSQRLQSQIDRLGRRFRFLPNTFFILVLILAGIALAGATSRIEPADKIRVANTAGTLTTLVSFSDQRILIGAGGSRSHAADFIGRATRPWDREIDLLIIPGWDDQHVTGALGLLERRSVLGIAVVGIPDEDPIWTLLEREAEFRDVPLRYITRPSQLHLHGDSMVKLAETQGDDEGMIVRVALNDKRIDVVDAQNPTEIRGPIDSFDQASEHIVISTRSQLIPSTFAPTLAVVPDAFWAGDFEGFASPYQVSLARNQSVEIDVEDEALRLPLEQVEIRPDN